MSEVLAWIAWMVGVAYLFWSAVAASRQLDRYYDRQGQP